MLRLSDLVRPMLRRATDCHPSMEVRHHPRETRRNKAGGQWRAESEELHCDSRSSPDTLRSGIGEDHRAPRREEIALERIQKCGWVQQIGPPLKRLLPPVRQISRSPARIEFEMQHGGAKQLPDLGDHLPALDTHPLPPILNRFRFDFAVSRHEAVRVLDRDHARVEIEASANIEHEAIVDREDLRSDWRDEIASCVFPPIRPRGAKITGVSTSVGGSRLSE